MGSMDNAADAEHTVDNKKTKKDKVRSAWISFAGRIVAQIVGAIATVALGVMVLHRYTATEARPPAAEARHESQAPPPAGDVLPQPAVHVIVLTPGMFRLRNADERFWSADQPCVSRVAGGR